MENRIFFKLIAQLSDFKTCEKLSLTPKNSRQGSEKKRFAETPGSGEETLFALDYLKKQIGLVNVEIPAFNDFLEVINVHRKVFHGIT
jgi:hypothetical protein